MMGEMIRQVCILSVICSAACNLAPEGGAKRIMAIGCSVILMLTVLSPLAEFDMKEYAASLAGHRELERALDMDTEEVNMRLNRLVIEQEYKSYIMDKAEEKKIALSDAAVELCWNTDGFWVPCAVTLYSDEEDETMGNLLSVLESELGISEENILCQSSG